MHYFLFDFKFKINYLDKKKINKLFYDDKSAKISQIAKQQVWTLEVEKYPVRDLQLHQVLHMNGGDGDNSYSNNSLLQVISLFVS
jgi:hypothetical protein